MQEKPAGRGKRLAPLSPAELDAAVRSGKRKVFVGGAHVSLWLQNGRYWSCLVKRGREIRLGTYPEVKLRAARDAANEAQQQTLKGHDPIMERRKAAAAVQEQVDARADTWGAAIDDYMESIKATLAPQTLIQYASLLSGFTSAQRQIPLCILTVKEALKPAYEAQERGKIPQAYNIQGRVIAVLWRARKRLPNHLLEDVREAELYRRPEAVRRRATDDELKIGNLVLAIQALSDEESASRVLKLVPYLPMRAQELARMDWAWINWAKRFVDFPKSIMKAKLPFLAPLNDSAFRLLKRWHELTGCPTRGLLFPGPRDKGKGVQSQTIMDHLEDVTDHTCTHGFRSIYETMIARHRESLAVRFPFVMDRGLCRACTAHKYKTSTDEAYDRHNYLEEKRQIMHAWDELLSGFVAAAADVAKHSAAI